MANKFEGTVLDKEGKVIVSANVELYINANTSPLKTTVTNKDGKFTINVENPVNPVDCEIIIKKDGKEFRSISNPQPTGNITIANLQINGALGGGVLNLQSQYAGGKYYFKSLGFEGDSGDLVRDEFDLNLTEVGNLIKAGLDKHIDIEISITGSESKIPNTDNEDFLIDGKTRNSNKGNSLPEQELAKRRVKYLNEHVINEIEKFTATSSLKTYYLNNKKETYIVSGPDYDNTKPKTNYIPFQYVQIRALSKKPLCSGVSISGQTEDFYKVPYIIDGTKWLNANALAIPDRFGFNNYLQPYYTITPTTANSDNYNSSEYGRYDLQALGLQIFFQLYILNDESTSFLDVTTNGLKLNYTKLRIAGNPETTRDNIQYVFNKLKNTLDPNNNKAYNESIESVFKDIITRKPNFFGGISANTRGSELIEAIKTKYNDLFKNGVPLAVIEVKREITKIDITKPEYGLRLGDIQLTNPNIINGISSVFNPEASKWGFCLCDDPDRCNLR